MINTKKKPIAYLLMGFISSGKTTYAKMLEAETNALRFTKDEFMIKIFGDNPKKIPNFEIYDSKMTELLTEMALESLRKGYDVIIDDGFWSRSQRKEIVKKLNELGVDFKIYYLKSSFDKLLEKTLIRNRNLDGSSFLIDKEMFNSYVKYFEEPGEEENVIIVDS